MIDFKDEILDGEARYNVRGLDGNVIHDDVTIEMGTHVVQEGTPLNKDFFTRFYNNIKSVQDLSWKWNQARVAKKWDDYNYLTLDNEIDAYEKGMIIYMQMPSEGFMPFSESIIPTFSSSTGTSINGFTIGGKTNPYLAFDKDDSTVVTDTAGSYTISFSNFHIKVREYKVKAKRGQSSYNVSVCGKREEDRNKTSYITIGTVEPRTGTSEPVVANYDGDYAFYQLYVDLTTSAGGQISTFDITKGEISDMHTNKNTYLNINNLGNVLIDKILSYDKKYKLVYDGTVFNATEVTE